MTELTVLVRSLTDYLWSIYFIGATAWIWLAKPPMPKGSGRNVIWIRYEDQPKKWRNHAYVITACIVFLCAITYFNRTGK